MKRYFDVIYWIVSAVLLLLIFGNISGNYIYSFYFISFFLPLLVATSWIFNKVLIPEYLLKKRYIKFGIYVFYLLVISLNLEMVLVFLAFMVLSYFDYSNAGSVLSIFRLLPLIMYFLVILSGFITLVRMFMLENSKEEDGSYITIRSERKNRKIEISSIIYIESMSDYVRIFLEDEQKVISRATISNLENMLPSSFLRIHRSYIVNRKSISSYTKEEIVIHGKALPISRTYKERVLSAIYS